MGYIRIDNLTKIYMGRRSKPRNLHDPIERSGDNILVLNNISMSFEEGEMVCILGPSGCGKSTLLRMIAGFENPTYGSIWVGDKPVIGPSDQSIFVFQHSGLFPWMTANPTRQKQEIVPFQTKELKLNTIELPVSSKSSSHAPPLPFC